MNSNGKLVYRVPLGYLWLDPLAIIWNAVSVVVAAIMNLLGF